MSSEIKTFKFFTDSITIKSVDSSEDSNYYVEGYISTSDLDRVGDVITKNGLDDMVEQLKNKNIKLDVEHEAVTNNPDIIPIGKIIEAKRDDKGVFVRAVINKHSSRFQEVWGSLKSGFIDAFSIAYRVVKKIDNTAGTAVKRILDKVELMNVALTGNPANPNCKITSVMTKSLEEGENMADEAIVAPSEPSYVAELKADAETLRNSMEGLRGSLAALESEMKSTKESSDKVITEMKSGYEAQIAELKSKIEAAEKALTAPQIKAHNEKPIIPDVKVTPLQMI